MKVGKNLLPWLLIASSVFIASITYQRQASLDAANSASHGADNHETDAVQRKDDNTDKQGTDKHGAGKLSPVPVLTRYQCDNQQTIQASYSDSKTQPSTVTLHINGQRYQLYSVPSQAGSLYATERGINPEQGMRWHVQGLEARLVSMTLDHTATPDQEQLLMRCQQPV